jgi:hypothetical protein
MRSEQPEPGAQPRRHRVQQTAGLVRPSTGSIDWSGLSSQRDNPLENPRQRRTPKTLHFPRLLDSAAHPGVSVIATSTRMKTTHSTRVSDQNQAPTFPYIPAESRMHTRAAATLVITYACPSGNPVRALPVYSYPVPFSPNPAKGCLFTEGCLPAKAIALRSE